MTARVPLLLASALAALTAMAPSVEAEVKPSRCSLKTLSGTYLYSQTGTWNGRPYSESGREKYDGNGGIEVVRRGSDGPRQAERGRYVISSDCIATMTYPNGFEMNSFVARDGSRFTFTITKASGRLPTAISGWEVRVND